MSIFHTLLRNKINIYLLYFCTGEIDLSQENNQVRKTNEYDEILEREEMQSNIFKLNVQHLKLNSLHSDFRHLKSKNA